MVQGLNSTEAAKKLKADGYNELASAKPKNLWRIVMEITKEPMFLLLITCAILYMVLGDYKEGVVMLCTVLIIIFITFYQYRKTEKALSALRKLSSPRALVIRDGLQLRIPGREVVVDDIILLNEGDRIAADAQLMDAINLTVDESMLTGESIPVIKTPKPGTSDSIYSGTLIVAGKGMAKVTSTGTKTQLGKIGTSLQKIEQDHTRLQKEMKLLIRNLFIAGAILSLAVVITFYFTRGNFIQSLLNGLAAAMALLPEEFPVVLTVFLALGAWRLSKINVLTRKPSAIETLGSATVLCADKTGTITQNKMAITLLYDGSDTWGMATWEKSKSQVSDLMKAARLASSTDAIDPMEKAIYSTYKELYPDPDPPSELLKEYSISHQLLAITRVIKNVSDNSISVSSKGAPEVIFKLCKLDQKEISKHLSVVDQMAQSGYRVIGVAKSTLKDQPLPDEQNEFNFSFLGLIALEDPVRPEVPQAIKECNEAGIKVIMITGDFPVTAKSIAKQIGLSTDKELITGDELDQMNDDELKTRIGNINIFARVVPEQKLRIVQALKSNNEVVAMTGDGVNDAPALKAADIGIAMGKKGTDVAREAASLVLLDDNFASIVSAIRSGRRIFDNLQKAMSYIIAIHIPIIGLALLPAFFIHLPLLLMPLHIVFMELIIDPVCSIAFESEQQEKGIMQRPPRDPSHKFFGIRNILLSILKGILLLGMVIVVYLISIREGHTAGEVRAIAFSSLIVGNIFLIITNLSKTRSFISVLKEKNLAVLIIIVAAAVLLFLVISIPALRKVFDFDFPGYQHFISSLAGAGIILFILELIKFISFRISTNKEKKTKENQQIEQTDPHH